MKQKVPSYLTLPRELISKKFRHIKNLEDERVHDGVVRMEKSRWSMQHGVHSFPLGRNRYVNILPYDYNRVKLDVLPGFCDYINASYVELDLGVRESYIATQGPTEVTTPHFWHMVLQQSQSPDVVVLMVTPLMEGDVKKCSKYWIDDVGDILEIPRDEGFQCSLKLECLENKDDPTVIGTHYTKIKLEAIEDGIVKQQRTVHHIYFDQWTDAMRPEAWEPIMGLSQLVRSLNGQGNAPIVHCSAGVGRTGTFITMDYLLSHSNLLSEYPGEDLIFAAVKQLREHRMSMVQSSDQYRFCYEMVKSFMEL
jgi:protein-tyrosine phosphatase